MNSYYRKFGIDLRAIERYAIGVFVAVLGLHYQIEIISERDGCLTGNHRLAIYKDSLPVCNKFRNEHLGLSLVNPFEILGTECLCRLIVAEGQVL